MKFQIQIDKNKIFAPILDKWLVLNQEEKLKQEFIVRLLNHYGYELSQLGQDVEIRKKIKVDIAIWKNSKDKEKNKIPSIIIAIECKAEHVSIKTEDILLSYKLASSVNANFFIATNLKETKVYHILNETAARKFDKLTDIPHATKIINDESISNYIQQTKSFTREEFTKLLSRCHNIIRNNDKLSPEAAFDEISKILFMKIMYERKSKEEIIFSLEKFKTLEKEYEERTRPTLKQANPNYDFDYTQYLFEETKRNFANDEIFEQNDRIKIRKNSFEQIVEELESFNLSDTSDDVKGIAFEEFLGKTFRGELGQFFTPRTIVDFMVDILDPQEGERICDPCCGSGGFLIKVFEYIREAIEKDLQLSKEKIKKEISKNTLSIKSEDVIKIDALLSQLDLELSLDNPKGRLKNLSEHSIYGTDANPRMARTAKMNMIMHGDGHGGVHHHDGLLNVNGVFENRFDVILTNPPFGSRVDKTLKVSNLDIPSDDKVTKYVTLYDNYEETVVNPLKQWSAHNNGDGKPIVDLFEVGSLSSLTEILFLERCLNLLKPGGRMGIVLPDGVLNNSNLQKVRDYIESKAKIILIISIPQDVFVASGANVKPSLVFLKKFTLEEEAQWKKIEEKARAQASEVLTVELRDDKDRLSKKQKMLEKGTIKSKTPEKGKSNKEDVDLIAQIKTEIKALKKSIQTKEKALNPKIEDMVKSIIKEEFNYQIPVAEIQKAGITSTGAPTDNELKPLAIEYERFRRKSKLWKEKAERFDYELKENAKISRFVTSDAKK